MHVWSGFYIWARRKRNERSAEGSSDDKPLGTSGPSDSPSRGLETGVVPLALLQIGDATGVMAVGDARPAGKTKERLSISGSLLGIPRTLRDHHEPQQRSNNV